MRVLEFLLSEGTVPAALLVTVPARASHRDDLIRLLPDLDEKYILNGAEFPSPGNIAVLQSLELDFIISVHFPYLVPPEALAATRHGWLNLHPSLLPFNRGWHTPSWTILEGTPAGVTLHFMDEGLDTGDIIAAREVAVRPDDTTDSLYRRLLAAEFEVFKSASPELAAGRAVRHQQDPHAGTSHAPAEPFDPAVQHIDLDSTRPAESLLRRLRALTTSDISEAAYFETEGRRFLVQVLIHQKMPERLRNLTAIVVLTTRAEGVAEDTSPHAECAQHVSQRGILSWADGGGIS